MRRLLQDLFSRAGVSRAFDGGAPAARAHAAFSAATPAAGEAREIARALHPYAGARSGSALLIVIGFLSFMIISGVSFSIYMRIERQASSNYRHSVTARHLLNAGLFRAMEEIDSELRLTDNEERKFPYWDGRVRASGVEDEDQNNLEARVLSIESLSFLPAILVNDVRRYAVRSKSNPTDKAWMGAKWRTLEQAMSGDVIGRYAYVCVNLSDMLDVNQCKALIRDSSTNRVSIGHLFDTDAQRATFDADVKKDEVYLSLQDFYAARYDRYKTLDSSPYHHYIKTGQLTAFDQAGNLKHVFCTDSIVKPQPTNSVACNITLNPPIEAAVLNTRRPTPNVLVFAKDKSGSKPFWEALKKTPRNFTVSAAHEQMMAAMIKDYLDTDNVPSLLNAPCVERVPMISQIVLDHDIFKPKIVSQDKQVGDPARTVTMYSVQLFGMPKAPADNSPVNAPLYVELMWPYKYSTSRVDQPTFDVEVEAYVQLNKLHQEQNTKSFTSKQGCVPLTQVSATRPSFWGKTITTEADCYEGSAIRVQSPKADVTIDIVDSEGTFYNGFSAGQDLSVSLIVFAKVKCGSDVVDSVPQFSPYLGALSADQEFSLTPKLFFQTTPRKVQAAMNVTPVDYEWWSLEVADPRFNYNASNWVKNDETPSTYVGKNPSTTRIFDQNIANQEGRDADLFMSVSDAGSMQSPGELGFIVRPFAYNVNTQPWDFRTEAEPKDVDFMFRTFRLYDHGGTGNDQIRDNVYEYLYAMKADGTLPGSRVNPLSDLPEVLEAAIWGTPLDYWLASTNNPLATAVKKVQTFNLSTLHFNNNVGTWAKFRDEWADALGKVTDDVNKEWKVSLSDRYGEWGNFKWYSPTATRLEIFGANNLLVNPLHEIDRKMLYSFSLDSFSDRQQLFLYILRAEATAPSFGGGSDGGMRSLSGGRAVALVWRDPYPRGYVKNNNTWDKKTGTDGWYPELSNFASPWWQYTGNTQPSSFPRYDSYHDTRILFFKQLDK